MLCGRFVYCADSIIAEVEVNPDWRVLEPRCIEQKHFFSLLIEPSDWAKVTIAGLLEGLSTKVQHLKEPIDSAGSVYGSLEQVKISLVEEHGAGVMVQTLGLARMAAVVTVVQVLTVNMPMVVVMGRHIFKQGCGFIRCSEGHRMQAIATG